MTFLKSCTSYPISDKLLFYILPSFTLISFGIFSISNVYFFHVYDFDFSFFLTQPWRIWNGWDAAVPFDMDIDGDVFWAHHLSLLGFLIAPLIGLCPSPYTLATLHALALGSIAFMIPHLVADIFHRFAQDENRNRWRWVSAFLLFIFNCFMPILGPLNYATHYTSLITPFIALALICMHRGQWKYVWLCAFIICLAQERAMVTLFGLGMYAYLILKEKSRGVILCFLSTVLFFSAVKIILPFLRKLSGCSTDYFFAQSIAPFSLLREKVIYIASCLISLCCLPFLSSRAFQTFICALPMISIGLIGNREGALTLKTHYLDIAAPFFLCAMVFGLLKFQEMVTPRTYRSILIAVSFVYVIALYCSPFRGCQPICGTVFLWNSPVASEQHLMRKEIEIFDSLPEDASLYAQEGLGPQMSFHKFRYSTNGDLQRATSREASLVVYSRFAAPYVYNDRAWAQDIADMERLPNMSLLCDTGRLRIYGSVKMRMEYPEYTESINTSLQCIDGQ